MKKILLVGVICVIAFAGYWGWYQYQRHQIINALTARYSGAVLKAANDNYLKLNLPATTDGKERAYLVGELMACSDLCEKHQLAGVTNDNVCDAICFCWVSGMKQAIPWNQKPTFATARQANQILDQCRSGQGK